MFLIVLSTVLAIVLFVLLSIRVEKEDGSYRAKKTFKPSKRCLFCLLAYLLCLLGTFTIVPVNNVGILYSPFGGTKEVTLKEGFSSKNIFDSVYKIPTVIQSKQIDNIITQTKDSQFVTSSISIKYKVSEDNGYIVFKQFKTLDKLSEQVIADSVQTNLEAVTTQYNVFDALGEGKPEIHDKLAELLAEDLSGYGVTFDSVTILDMDGGDTVEEAIAAEAKATQAIEIAEKQVQEAKILAQKQVEEAMAKKEAAAINAETLLIEANAQKEANELLKVSYSELLAIKEWIEKWNGQTPEFYGGDGTDLIFNTGTLE